MFRPVPSKVDFPKLEEEILQFWKQHQVFLRTMAEREKALAGLSPEQRRQRTFVLYEGPPTANGSPGLHHVLARVFKDVIPRYKTMKGFYAPRKAGWDTHGLPVELEVEKELGFSSKKDIEDYGMERFNARCRESVHRYLKEWEALTERIAFWVDMKDSYVTFDNRYIESGWWILEQLWKKQLIYQGHRVTPHCPRCVTSLSDHEVALGYQDDVDDPSVFVKFRVANPEALDLPPGAFLMAWTTTPWTLPGNTGLAVNPAAEYVVVETEGGTVILARSRLEAAIQGEYRELAAYPGERLAQLRYEPLYDPFSYGASVWQFERLPAGNAWEATGRLCQVPGNAKEPLSYPVLAAEIVSLEEGTGVLHLAPAFGDADYELGKSRGLHFVQPVDAQGTITGSYPFAGRFVKEADPLILRDLKEQGYLYRSERLKHTYPFCWRCRSPLLYYAKNSWYIRTTAHKQELIANNERINWYPEHIKRGRFGDWLRNNVDWAISRERYWGTPLPVWQCPKCHSFELVGSLQGLREKPGIRGLEGLTDLHRPYIDQVTFACAQCGGEMRRVPEVLDCWFDSGAMPYAQWHYPFENQDLFQERFPADYICEGVDQTRGWFYSLHALAVMLKGEPSYKNVICLGHILDSEGEKMSKSRGNVVEPWTVISRHGADALRWYLYTASPAGTPRRFSVDLVGEVVKKFLLTLWNTYSFFVTYANIDGFDPRASYPQEPSLLDRWIISELNLLIQQVTSSLDGYDPTVAARKIEAFVDDLSNWYVRRSRRRFWKSENDADKWAAYATLYRCLETVSRLLAPFTPFLAEELYRNLAAESHRGLVRSQAPVSVHLALFPEAKPDEIDADLGEAMHLAMQVTSLGRAARSQAGLKIRQPLARMAVKVAPLYPREAFERLSPMVLDELNIKEMSLLEDIEEVLTALAEPKRAEIGKKYRADAARVLAAVAAADPRDLAKTLERDGKVTVNGFELGPDVLAVVQKEKPGYSVAFQSPFFVAVTTELTPELVREGLAREIVHRLQTMRREAGFDIADHIATCYQADDALRQVMVEFDSYVRQETLSQEVLDSAPSPGSYQETHRLSGHDITLAVKRIP